jgi:hypothetical protein
MYGFASGSVPFMISKAKCWFSEFIIPFVHYIPIKYDLSDLIEKIEWVNENDGLAKKIAEKINTKYPDLDIKYLFQRFLKLCKYHD